MTEPTRPQDLPKQKGYFEQLRTYEKRLADWLGLRSAEVVKLTETRTGESTAVDPPGLRIDWSASAMQKPVRGRNAGLGRMQSVPDPTAHHYFGAVQLDFDELREMRGEIGERPMRGHH